MVAEGGEVGEECLWSEREVVRGEGAVGTGDWGLGTGLALFLNERYQRGRRRGQKQKNKSARGTIRSNSFVSVLSGGG